VPLASARHVGGWPARHQFGLRRQGVGLFGKSGTLLFIVLGRSLRRSEKV
jgi:hypothetical protein